ncbi:MAG: carbon-nitrogen hydrolase family protein [Candidatus Aenigmatarchaeota archaeon]|nr:MAG: carbon-nitrogen hydrolase family protein [Candidatus Aenigmarchaeota archaeon]
MNSPGTPNSFKAAVIQQPPVFLNIEASVEKACVLIEQAAGQGANVIAFPETWLPGYPVWLDFSPNVALWDHPPAKTLYRLLVENSVAIPGKHLDRLLASARKTGAYVIMGLHERLGGTLYNTTIYIARDGKEFQLHRKLLPTYTERMVWGRGDGSTLSILNTDYGVLGGLICWEHWMPLARAAMHARRETIHVAQWPYVKELHHLASRHYAFEGQCFVLAAGCMLSRGEAIEGFHSLGRPDSEALELLEAMPGGKEDLILRGGSAVIAPDADYVAGPVYDEPCIIYADIDPGRITEGHLFLDTQGHYSRPDIFHLEVDDRPQANVTFKAGGYHAPVGRPQG